MDKTRRDILSGLFVGSTCVIAGCSGSTQSTNGSNSQPTTNSEGQSSSDTEAATSISSSNPDASTQISSTETTLSDNSSPTAATQTRRDTTASESDTQSGEFVGEGQNWSAKDSPQFTVTIGNQNQLDQYDEPHSIFVWNDNMDSRTIHINLVPVDNRKHNGFQKDFELVSDSYVLVKMAQYQSYTLKVGANGNPAQKVRQISKDMVDCNTSSTHIAVRSDGSIDATTSSTEMLCELPPTTDTTDDK